MDIGNSLYRICSFTSLGFAKITILKKGKTNNGLMSSTMDIGNSLYWICMGSVEKIGNTH